MVCRKCRTALPDGSRYCLSCGAKQDITRRPRSRGNGTGSVYQQPSKTWIAVRICGWYTAEDGSIRRKTRSKSGFRTKKEALEYLPLLAVTPAQERSRHITELYVSSATPPPKCSGTIRMWMWIVSAASPTLCSCFWHW